MKLPLWRIAEFVGAKGHPDLDGVATGYSIDSRTLNPGDLFIALQGDAACAAISGRSRSQAVGQAGAGRDRLGRQDYNQRNPGPSSDDSLSRVEEHRQPE